MQKRTRSHTFSSVDILCSDASHPGTTHEAGHEELRPPEPLPNRQIFKDIFKGEHMKQWETTNIVQVPSANRTASHVLSCHEAVAALTRISQPTFAGLREQHHAKKPSLLSSQQCALQATRFQDVCRWKLRYGKVLHRKRAHVMMLFRLEQQKNTSAKRKRLAPTVKRMPSGTILLHNGSIWRQQ